mgnify:CR=1 FL=1
MLLGLDIGSSSVKAVIVDPASGKAVTSASAPSQEMEILAPQPGWAEQYPDIWWKYVLEVLAKLKSENGSIFGQIKAIGISYQMHGLVCLDRSGQPLRPSIIWCDSRAVSIGEAAFRQLGTDYCLSHLLNAPGNFTASKLRWVKDYEPEIFDQIDKMMLPGDYIAYRLTGEISTTTTGLSEGVMWDFAEGNPASRLLEYYGIPAEMLAPVTEVFSRQGSVTSAIAAETGLPAGIPVAYRAGDQPNNAFSLNVLHPGETAATAGTSGVIYSVSERPAADARSRVNTFLHVNHTAELHRNGILLCINGTGILNSWLRRTLGQETPVSYDTMNHEAATVPIGSGGLSFLPFGNGAERILDNRNPGATLFGLDLNRHSRAHVLRAAQEGIVFAMAHGFGILRDMGAGTEVVRAGKANMFLSPLFREAFVNTLQVPLELYETNGATGAALGAGIGAGIFSSFPDAFTGLELLQVTEPDPRIIPDYREAFRKWSGHLEG